MEVSRRVLHNFCSWIGAVPSEVLHERSCEVLREVLCVGMLEVGIW